MKKVLLSVLLLLSICSLRPLNVFAFEDVDESESEVYFLKESNVVQGRQPGIYNPELDVNRVEMLKILLESNNISPDANIYKNCFPDVHEEWYAKYVCYAKSQGIVVGYPDGYFRPGNTVNLAEALKMSFNTFNQELEEMEGDWYSSFLHTARSYGVMDSNIAPSEVVSRKLMAQLSARVGLVGITQKQFRLSDIEKIRKWGKTIQDFSNPIESAEISGSLWEGDNAVVTITANTEDSFTFKYSHDTITVAKGSADIDQDPTIEVGADGARFGLNADRRWDGDVSFVDNTVLRADVDLSGFYGNSINVRWDPQSSLIVSDKMGERTMTINMQTGGVSGDKQLTQGIQNVKNVLPFEVCVSDYDGYIGGVTIINLSSIELGGCSKNPPLIKSTVEEMVSKLRIPGAAKKPIPLKPKKPTQKNPGGAVDGDDGVVEIPEDEECNDDIKYPTTDTKKGLDNYEEKPPFPAPKKHPGKHEAPQLGYNGLEKSIERLEKQNAKAAQTAQDNQEIFASTINHIEDAFEKYDIDKPTNPPTFNPGECCPSYEKEGKCCTDLDLSTEAGRAEYQKRQKCLADAFNDENEKLKEYLASARKFAKDAKDLERMEANFAQLWLGIQLNKIMAHTVIDVATGNVSSIKGAVAAAISNAFGDTEAAAFDGIHDPSSMPGNYGNIAKDAAIGTATNELLDFKNNVAKAAGEVADSLGLTGIRKDAFIENAKDKFGDSPMGLFDPTTWAKLIYDATVDEAGSAAQNILETVKKYREDRNANYLAAWRSAHLAKQINEVIKKVKTEDCSKAMVKELKKEVERRKEAIKKYREREAEDAKAIYEAIKWILNYKMHTLVGDNPDPEVVKEAIIKELERQLCLLGYDLCWIDIKFKVTYEKTETGYKWTLDIEDVVKRDTRKEPCDCPFPKELNEEDQTEDQTTDDTVYETQQSTDTVVDEPAICCECVDFIPEEYQGKVRFDSTMGLFIATEYEGCMFDIAEPIVHDRFIMINPDEGEMLFMEFMAPENEGVEFDMLTGDFYLDGQVVDLLQ